jgi:hypothetical protein
MGRRRPLSRGAGVPPAIPIVTQSAVPLVIPIALVIAASFLLAGCGASESPTGGSPLPTSPPASASAPAPTASSASPSSAPTPEASPTALPDSVTLPSDGQIVYTSGVPGPTHSIMSVAPDGSGLALVAVGRDPAWAPSGQTLVYTCPVVGNEGDFPGICAVAGGSIGAEPHVLVAMGERPVVAPTGTTVAYHRGMIDVGETWIAGIDGSGAVLLTPGELTTWSPDGVWLAGQPESAGAEIAVIRPDGTRYRVLTGGYDPAWSPDGGRLAYGLVTANGASLRFLDLATGTMSGLYLGSADVGVGAPLWLSDDAVLFVKGGDLWRIDPDGFSPVRLTSGLGISGRLSLSPDKQWVVFATGRVHGAEVTSKLVVASVEGGWRVLETGAEPVSQPAWRPTAGG